MCRNHFVVTILMKSVCVVAVYTYSLYVDTVVLPARYVCQSNRSVKICQLIVHIADE